MLDRIVHHLRTSGISFRLSSQPSPEPLPAVAPNVPPGGLFVETRVLLVGGRPAVAAIPRGAQVSLPALTNELNVEVIEGTPADLPPPYASAVGHVPPLGSAMGAPTFIDTRVSLASAIVFGAFTAHDFIEIPFDEYARLERPRISSFAVGGELPERAGTERKAA